MEKGSKKAIQQLDELERLGEGMRLAADGWDEPWKTLVAVLMSARTRDEVTISVGEKLFAKYKTVQALASADLCDLEEIVFPLNFYRSKARSILLCAQALRDIFGCLPPHDIDKLTSLPGVGRKTANVFLARYGQDAIGVDTHVSYISRALGWTLDQKPEKIERDLKNLFPRHLWKTVNETCVHFGKTYVSRREKDAVLTRIRALE